MKKFLFAFVAGCIPALAVTNAVYAQNLNSIALVELPNHVFNIGKDLTSEKSNTVNINVISTKAVKDFKRSYKTVTGEKWFGVSDGFMAEFNSNGINNQVFYTKKGQWVASLKGYREDNLAHDVRDIVKRQYYDYKINFVQEIETVDTHGIPTYIVHIEDDNNIKLVRVNDGEMDVYKEFKK